MKVSRLDNYEGNWIVGNFYPTLVASDQIEISIRYMNKYSYEGFYYRERDTVNIVILDGCIRSNNHEYFSGEILTIPPGELHDLLPLQDSRVLFIKSPGGGGDKHIISGNDLLMKASDLSRYLCLYESENISNNCPSRDDITAIVQGPIEKDLTPQCLKSIRKQIPGARIVLSTWKGSDVSDLDYDSLVYNDDPGSNVNMPYLWGGNVDVNFNRQLISTSSALELVETRYTLKIRTDMALINDGFRKYFYYYPRREKKWELFKERIVMPFYIWRSNDLVLNGKKVHFHQPYYMNDNAWFGLTEDIRTLVNCQKKLPNEGFALDFDFGEAGFKRACVSPENVFFVNAFHKKFTDVCYEDITLYHENPEVNERSYRLIMNNFLILGAMRSGMFIMKPKYLSLNIGMAGDRRVVNTYGFYEQMDYYNELIAEA